MDGRNFDEVYLKKIHAKAVKGYFPKNSKAVTERKALNKQILERRKTLTKENTANRGPGFKAFMQKAEENGYIKDRNYGLYATFYDVYNPDDPSMKKIAKNILDKPVGKYKANSRSFDQEATIFMTIVKSVEANKTDLKKMRDNQSKTTLDKFIRMNHVLFADYTKGQSLGFAISEKEIQEERKQRGKEKEALNAKTAPQPKNKYANMSLDEMEKAMNNLLKQHEEEVALDNELNNLQEKINQENKVVEENKAEVKEEEKKVEENKEEKREDIPRVDLNPINQVAEPVNQVVEPVNRVAEPVKQEENPVKQEDAQVIVEERPIEQAEEPQRANQPEQQVVEDDEVRVHNMTFDQFAQSMSEKGWEDAKNDTVLFAVFALSADRNFRDLGIMEDLMEIEKIESAPDLKTMVINSAQENINVKKKSGLLGAGNENSARYIEYLESVHKEINSAEYTGAQVYQNEQNEPEKPVNPVENVLNENQENIINEVVPEILEENLNQEVKPEVQEEINQEVHEEVNQEIQEEILIQSANNIVKNREQQKKALQDLFALDPEEEKQNENEIQNENENQNENLNNEEVNLNQLQSNQNQPKKKFSFFDDDEEEIEIKDEKEVKAQDQQYNLGDLQQNLQGNLNLQNQNIKLGGNENEEKNENRIEQNIPEVHEENVEINNPENEQEQAFDENLKDVEFDPNKIIYGRKASEFLKEVGEKNGWPDAENDGALRHFCNLYNPDEAGMLMTASGLLDGRANGKVNENNLKERQKAIIDSVNNCIEDNPNLIKKGDEKAIKSINQIRKALGKEQFELQNENHEIENNNEIKNNNENENINELQNQNIVEHQNHNQNVNENIMDNRNLNPELNNPNQNEADNKLAIIDPNKTISGMNFQQFADKLQENGWENAEADNTLRALFNLASEDNRFKDQIDFLKDKQIGEGENLDDQRNPIWTAIRDEYIVPAKRGESKGLVSNEKKASVLHIQQELRNHGMGENFDYENDIKPLERNPERPVEENNNPEHNRENNNNREQNLENNNRENNNRENNNRENNNRENNNRENNQENKPENNDEQLNPVRAPKIKVSDMKSSSIEMKNRLKEVKSSLLLGGNSKAFKQARSSYEVFKKKMDQVSERKIDDDQPLSRRDIRRLREQASQSREKINDYLQEKDKECGGNFSKLGKRVQRRYKAMSAALEDLDAQIEELDAREEELNNEPTKSLKELDDMFSNTQFDMVKAEDVFWGSKEYGDALTSYKNVTGTVKDLLDKEQEGEELSGIDIAEARRAVKFARDNIDAYLMKHDDEDKIGDKRANRMDSMADGRDNLDRLEKKLIEMEKKYMESEPKPQDELKKGVEESLTLIDKTAKKEGVGFGPYKDAQKKYRDFHKTLFQDQNEQDFDKMTPARRAQIEKKMNEAEQEIDKFLDAFQKRKNPPSDTKERAAAMRKAKESIIEIRKKMEHSNKKAAEADRKKSDVDVRKDTQNSSNEITKSENQAFFGSLAYRRARKSYEGVHGNLLMRNRANKGKNMSEEDLEKSLKEVEEAKKNIAKYISQKRKELAKKGSLDEKGARRLAAMEKAYDSLDAVEHRISGQLKTKRTARLTSENKNTTEKGKQLKESSRTATGSERNINRAASDAITALQGYGEKKKLSPKELQGAKKAMAALLLKQHAEKYGKESIMNSTKPKEYAASIKKLTESKGFRKAFPDKKITADYIKKIVNNPKELERARLDLMEKMSDGNAFVNKNATKKQNDPIKEQNKNKNPMMK